MKKTTFMRSGVTCLLALLLAALAGCGPRRPETVSVSGRVFFDGQPPPKPGMIYFAPLEPAEGFPRRPGRAAFDTDGHFIVTTFTESDGLMPGRYRVGIDCWQTPPQAEGPPAVSLVPEAYREPGSSGLELVVEPGAAAITADFNIPGTPL